MDRTVTGAGDALEALCPLLLKRGSPQYSRSDNGPEFAAEALQNWLIREGVKPFRINPGLLWESGSNVKYSETPHHEVLIAEWITTTEQAQIVID